MLKHPISVNDKILVIIFLSFLANPDSISTDNGIFVAYFVFFTILIIRKKYPFSIIITQRICNTPIRSP